MDRLKKWRYLQRDFSKKDRIGYQLGDEGYVPVCTAGPAVKEDGNYYAQD
jgi:hypothetical protein